MSDNKKTIFDSETVIIPTKKPQKPKAVNEDTITDLRKIEDPDATQPRMSLTKISIPKINPKRTAIVAAFLLILASVAVWVARAPQQTETRPDQQTQVKAPIQTPIQESIQTSPPPPATPPRVEAPKPKVQFLRDLDDTFRKAASVEP